MGVSAGALIILLIKSKGSGWFTATSWVVLMLVTVLLAALDYKRAKRDDEEVTAMNKKLWEVLSSPNKQQRAK